ncbi:pilus assembly protein [Sphaerotilus sp.]|uniref:pilus assembly protein n=1 Tax=Sphaerotilus sp. TaxID=2093942 RepID=UPI002ACE4077|nr:PilC/PilY family type IV pilus protein [Sphaerotilus sp.]MDZ7858454.1 PilC/PilY family type IV pilus protein [Sphaerotilus sp.]
MPHRRPPLGPLTLAAALACGAVSSPFAQTVEIADGPLSATLSQVKPNIMFILDDSGSMGDAHMPDEAGVRDADGNPGENYGYRSTHCNGLAFNPALPYRPPVRADGTLYPDASFTAAPNDGFNPAAGSTSLDGSVYYHYKNDKKLTPMSWAYKADGTIDRTTPFYKDCTQVITEPSDQFIPVTLTTASDAALRQKYANWYAYYRTRRLLMRTATGEAFRSIGSEFRVGFTVISDSSVTSTSFLGIEDFTGTQRSSFYNLLYTAQTNGGFTPLRGALSKTGRYFANKFPGQKDPIQYSCQRNYALLSTDGYWNSGMSGYPGLETSNYGPINLNGTPVGQQDGAEERPMKDSTGTAGGGDSNSLADVAQYFWATDLRTDMPNNVPATKRDPATHQHLNTFTVGLGVQGILSYDRNYLTQLTGDFVDLKNGTKNWPVPTPTDVNPQGDATHIDDLWHAAVNGRGQYFSATDPKTLSDAISTTLNEISKDAGSSAAASASSLTPVTGDNWVFLPSYSNSPTWHGDLRAFQFTTNADTSGLIAPNTSSGTAVWSARDKLQARMNAAQFSTRTVKFGSNTNQLIDFTYTNLLAQGKNVDFDNLCTASPVTTTLSHCDRLIDTARAKATGENLVNFLRGDMRLQMSATAPENQVFRDRKYVLGDFVNAAPVYVAKPPFKYADAGYTEFVKANETRRKMVYAAANDGMLHAFQVGSNENDATGGEELWAFVPKGVMSQLRRLADVGYDASHRNLLDATPTIGDIFAGGQWRTILVGGMGAGGRNYYALDITTPESPKLLWEFDDVNLGYTFGNPVITKDATGTWIVAFTSGLNNVTGNDGRGRLYLLDAFTGEKRSAGRGEIVTAAGNATTPNNLGRLNAWVPSDTDNTALRFYAGDMQGNLWRFDHDDLVAPAGVEATLLGQALGPDLRPQPITAKPVLTELFADNQPVTVVSFATGRLLNNGDLSTKEQQSVYSIRDTLDSTGLGPLRDPAARLVRQELNANRRVDEAKFVNWNTQNGWYVDLKETSERVALDGIPLGADLIAFASTVPNGDPCGNGGNSYLYQFQLSSGDVRDLGISDSLIVGVSRVMDSAGRVSAFFTKRDQSTELKAAGVSEGGPPKRVRRAAWRELN